MPAARFRVSRVQGVPVGDSELLADIRRVASHLGSSRVTMAQYSDHGHFDTSTFRRRFGSWNKALLTAGLAVSNEVDIPDERLFENILVLWQHYGRQPRRAELSRPPSAISQSPYRRRFRSWVEALHAFVEYADESEASLGSSCCSAGASSKPATGRDPSLRMRFKVLQRDRFRCRACGATPATDSTVHLHVDHITPWSAGGETTMENLQTLCSNCNLGKSGLSVSSDSG